MSMVEIISERKRRGPRHQTGKPTGNYRRGERTGPARNEITAMERAAIIQEMRDVGLTFLSIGRKLGCSANAAWLVLYRQQRKADR